MIKAYARITSIDNKSFGNGLYTLYSPASNLSEDIQYMVSLDANVPMNPSDLNNIKGNLINTKTGAVHSIKKVSYVEDMETESQGVVFYLSSETAEDDDINCLEISFIHNNEGFEQEVITRVEIRIKKIKEALSTFNYNLGSVTIIDSNLLSPRVKMGFANWSTVHKNDISNTSKLLEPLHRVYTNSFTKSNELLKQTYDLNYTPETFSRIFLHGYPLNIIRKTADGIEELKEADDIFSSIRKVEVSESDATIELIKIYLTNDVENNKVKLENLTLPTTLYLRKLNSNNQIFCECIVKGFDEFQNPITESVILRSDLYTQLQNTYERITSIYYGNNDIEVSTYVDLRYHHYIISRPYIVPPIVDKNFTAFKPHPVIKTNQELDRNTLVINNGLSNAGVEEYKLSFSTDEAITSLYVNEELDVLYTTPSIITPNMTALNYSKLRIDYTKNIFNDKTLNNNRYIVVSDSKTSIGDWVDVTVNTQDWFDNIEQKSLLLRVRNDNTVLYYNQETGELAEDKVYFYSDLANTGVLEVSVNVENNLPYIFSIVSEDGTTVSAMSCIDTIDSYYSEEIIENSMIHFNGEVVLVPSTGLEHSNSIYDLVGYENDLAVVLSWGNYSTLNYKISLKDGYYISSDGSNLNPDFYKITIPENTVGGPILLTLDKEFLVQSEDTFSFDIGLSFDSSNGIFSGKEYAVLSVSNTTDIARLELPIVPEQQYTPTHKMQYTIHINSDGSVTSEETVHDN